MSATATENRTAGDDLQVDLAHFNGTEDYHVLTMSKSLLATDGVKYLCEKAGAYWLMDVIASHQISMHVRREEFQVWKLTKLHTEKTPNGAMIRCTDGNDKQIVQQRIPYTDFPLEEFTLYAEVGSVDGVTPCRVVMLPGER